MSPYGLLNTGSVQENAVLDPPESVEAFGDDWTTINDSTFRIMSVNIGGFPLKEDTEKDKLIRTVIDDFHCDVFLFNEVNVAWQHIDSNQRFAPRVQGWSQNSRSVHAWNRSFAPSNSARQFGGTAIAVLGSASGRVSSTGYDRSGLGRWCWVRLKGRNGRHIRIFSGYRPVKNERDGSSVYNQHKLYYESKGDFTTCPRAGFMVDLRAELDTAKRHGDDVIMGIDFNGPIETDTDLVAFFRDYDIVDQIIRRHGSTRPSREDSPKAIDTLCASQVLAPERVGISKPISGLSDHAILWADYAMKDMFGIDSLPATSARARRLQCSDPRVVEKYLKRYFDFLIKHDLFQRASKLESELKEGQTLTRAQAKEFEEIDRLRVAGQLAAEKGCRRLRMGKVAWSPELAKALNTHRYWKLVSLKEQGRKISAKRLSRLAKKCSLRFEPRLPLPMVLKNEEDALSDYRRIKKKATSKRNKWLHDLAIARAEAGLEKAADALRAMQQKEKIRSNFGVIKKALNNKARAAMTSVTETDCYGQEIERNTKEEVELAGLKEFEARLRQANDTPLQQQEAINYFGTAGESEGSSSLLASGKVPAEISSIDPFLGDFLKEFKAAPVDVFSTVLPTSAHVQGWKKPKERTSSGPSRIHFGHFIAGVRHDQIAMFEACMSSIPWTTGYSPKRWQQSLDVMIPKKLDDFHVQRLRTIMLFEADFNQGNKWLGREMMYTAELWGLLAPEQYGSRKYHTAINQGLNKRLTFDLWRQKKQRGALCSTDAKSCYDRIVPVAASLAMQRVGTPKHAVKCMLDTYQKIRHYVRSAFGDSEVWFDSDDSSGIPIHGTGQGNGASPAIWALVSTPIFNGLRKRGYGVLHKNAIDAQQFTFAGYAFVDDTDLAVTDDGLTYDEHSTSIFDKIQDSVELWEGFIRCSGGAIRPDKSHWYLVDFSWKDGFWSYKDDDQSVLHVRNPEGELEPIEKIPVSEGRRTVGVRLAPDGNNADELRYLQEEAKQWSEKTKTNRLPRDLVWLAFTTGICRKLQYSLPATTFSREDCKAIMTPLLEAVLPSTGVNRHFPWTMRHAPLSHQGLAITDLYVEQGLQHLQTMVDCTSRQNDITGRLIEGSTQQLQLELGVQSNPFAVDHSIYRCLATDCWVTNSWDFAVEHEISIQTPDTVVPFRRKNDQMFMEFAVSRGFYSPDVLATLNRCRLFLQIARLSDMISADGRTLRTEAFQGSRFRHSDEFEWPRQGLPSQTDWSNWRETLISLFGLQLPSLALTVPLGEWQDSAKDWKWFESEGELVSVDRDLGQVMVYQVISKSRKRASYRRVRSRPLVHLLNKFWRRADVWEEGEIAHCGNSETHGISGEGVLDLHIPECTLQQARIDKLRHSTSWCRQFEFTDFSDANLLQMVNDLEHGTLSAVSDGSTKDGLGAAAWILEGTSVLSGGYTVPGAEEDQDSYRSEMAGLIAILEMVTTAAKIFQLQHPVINVGCDGKSPLLRLFHNERPAMFRDSHWDLLWVAKRLVDLTPRLEIFWRHVKGHQDDDPKSELDQWALWNISMDLHAKWIREQEAAPASIPYVSSLWRVSTCESTLVQNGLVKLREHCTKESAVEYWMQKGDIGSALPEQVDWDCLGQAMKDQPASRRRWITKHTTGWCGVNKNLVRWQEASDASCARCGAITETAQHIWKCQSESATEVWEEGIQKLESWMDAQFTQKEVKRVIIDRLSNWRAGARRAATTSIRMRGLRKAVLEQDRIGWSAAFMGKWSKEWAAVQESYYQFLNKKKTGKRWVTSLISKLWDIAWDLWVDRNGTNITRALEIRRVELENKVRKEYEQGVIGLHRRTYRLITGKPLDQRLQESTHSLEGWLLRVTNSRARAQEEDPLTANEVRRQAQEERRRRRQEEVERQAREVNQQRLSLQLWLRPQAD